MVATYTLEYQYSRAVTMDLLNKVRENRSVSFRSPTQNAALQNCKFITFFFTRVVQYIMELIGSCSIQYNIPFI